MNPTAKKILGWTLGVVALGVTVYVAAWAWKKGQIKGAA